jgi:hypothetical protein
MQVNLTNILLGHKKENIKLKEKQSTDSLVIQRRCFGFKRYIAQSDMKNYHA